MKAQTLTEQNRYTRLPETACHLRIMQGLIPFID